jgi:uncharacterized protein
VDSWEYQEDGRPPDADDEGLDCPYLDGPRLDVLSWLRDAAIEAMPDTLLCREDCAGLCGGCGVDLNREQCRCGEPEPDPRWAGLAEIAERLRDS